MNIPDPNLYYAIQNFVEEQGGFLDYHLNSKVLDMPIEYLLDFALLLENDKEKVKESIRKKVKFEKMKSIGRSILEQGESITNIMANICDYFDPTNIITKKILNWCKGE